MNENYDQNQDRDQNRPNMNQLTPFEAALAGSDVSNDHSPSTAVVANLRALLAETRDAPITQPRLREFVEDENAIGRRGAKRSIMRRNASARTQNDNEFIDITPDGLSTPGHDLFGATTGDLEADHAPTHEISLDAITTEDLVTDEVALNDTPLDDTPLGLAGQELSEPASLGDDVVDDLDDEGPALLFPGVPDIEAPAMMDVAEHVETGQYVETAQYEQLAAPESVIAADDLGADDLENANLSRLPSLAESDVDSAILAGVDDNYNTIDTKAPAMALAGVVPLKRSALAGKAAALTASAAAAAVLLVGGLWWARDLGGSAETSAAGTQAAEGQQVGRSTGPDQGVVPSVDQTDQSDPSPSEARSTTSGTDQGQTTSQDDSGSDTFAPESSAEPDDSPGESAPDSSDEDDPAATDEDPSSTEPDKTDQTETTDDEPTTTEVPTTEAPAPIPETTKPPGTKPVEPTEAPTEPTSPAFQETTASPFTPQALTYIGDKVYLGGWSGPGQGGITVELFSDSNRNGQANFRVATQVTSSAGRYSFNVESGCYVVRFTAPGGFYIDENYQDRPLCVGSGEVWARMDSIVYQLTEAPDGCGIDLDADGGVEVYENSGNWAPSYSFYNASGNLLAETKNMGGPDDIDSASDREWWGYSNGFDHLSVTWITAERNGMVSEWVRCTRGT